ncbi:unnamed protein product [Prorocentrum cordatum]|uniref:Alpha-galactosidase n=1 Tax=Prorocentrum cordatum TaxID=2364126 RepID=A0ABN9XHH2_9DINO|nr:unnamed protein product [Polarella glacialis]
MRSPRVFLTWTVHQRSCSDVVAKVGIWLSIALLVALSFLWPEFLMRSEALAGQSAALHPEDIIDIMTVSGGGLTVAFSKRTDHSQMPGYVSVKVSGPAGTAALYPRRQLFAIEFDDGVRSSSEDCTPDRTNILFHNTTSIAFLLICELLGASLHVEWSCHLQSARVARVSIQIFAPNLSRTVRVIDMLTVGREVVEDDNAHIPGTVQGLPIVFRRQLVFFGIEHPMSVVMLNASMGVVSMPLYGQQFGQEPMRVTAAFGAYRSAQLRRDFQEYIEESRAVAWRQWLHFNSWYTLKRPDPFEITTLRSGEDMNVTNVIQVARVYSDQLARSPHHLGFRGVLLDDGWDDCRRLWKMHDGFPENLQQVTRGLEAMGLGGLGVWLSPWGGYGFPRELRLEYGYKEGLETNSRGFSLAGPKYSGRFFDICASFIRDHGVSFFKFDGIAGGQVTSGAPSEFAADVLGLLRLVQRLRSVRPDLFISLTVGTWPSPYFLHFADAVWRGAHDTARWGAGRGKHQWITYRDMIVHELVSLRSPLYPLSSLMLHGVVMGDSDPWCRNVSLEPGLPAHLGLWDFSCEVWSFFATGANIRRITTRALPYAAADERGHVGRRPRRGLLGHLSRGRAAGLALGRREPAAGARLRVRGFRHGHQPGCRDAAQPTAVPQSFALSSAQHLEAGHAASGRGAAAAAAAPLRCEGRLVWGAPNPEFTGGRRPGLCGPRRRPRRGVTGTWRSPRCRWPCTRSPVTRRPAWADACPWAGLPSWEGKRTSTPTCPPSHSASCPNRARQGSQLCRATQDGPNCWLGARARGGYSTGVGQPWLTFIG